MVKNRHARRTGLDSASFRNGSSSGVMVLSACMTGSSISQMGLDGGRPGFIHDAALLQKALAGRPGIRSVAPNREYGIVLMD